MIWDNPCPLWDLCDMFPCFSLHILREIWGYFWVPPILIKEFRNRLRMKLACNFFRVLEKSRADYKSMSCKLEEMDKGNKKATLFELVSTKPTHSAVEVHRQL